MCRDCIIMSRRLTSTRTPSGRVVSECNDEGRDVFGGNVAIVSAVFVEIRLSILIVFVSTTSPRSITLPLLLRTVQSDAARTLETTPFNQPLNSLQFSLCESRQS